MNTFQKFVVGAIFANVAVFLSPEPASATLLLTTYGTTEGFNLNTFMSSIPYTGYCCGPLGIATNNAGNVVLQDYYYKNDFVFSDTNGQTFAPTNPASPTFGAGSYGTAITNSGGTLYAGNNDTGLLYKLNNDGSVASQVVTTPGGTVAGHGIATNPVTGHIVSASGNGIWDINPSTGAATQVVANGGAADGVSVSGDGKIIYGAVSGHVYGWDYSGNLVFDSGNIGSPDGTGVIQGNNKFAGDIVANGNDGNVWLLNPSGFLPDLSSASVLLASGGTRGDYVGLDGTNGSLFLTQTSEVLRLTCGPNCFFTAPPPAMPEPETPFLLLTGLLTLSAFHYRKRGYHQS